MIYLPLSVRDEIEKRSQTGPAKMAAAIKFAVEQAGKKWPCSDADTKLRVNLCVQWVREHLNDMRWSLPRALDEMHRRLDCHIEGIPWSPSIDTSTWAGSDWGAK